MARRTASRMELRRQAEAAQLAEPAGATGANMKRGPSQKRAAGGGRRRKSEKASPRKMKMWAVYNGNLKEEGRYNYEERDRAEEKLESLRAKATKKLYFLQPIKVPLSDVKAAIDLKADRGADDEDAVPTPDAGAGEEE